MKILNKNLKVISTFNGIGAFSDALKSINIKSEKIICEIDKDSNNTYYENNKYIPENHVDDINELLKKIKKNTKCDILVQTPPCTTFSSQGLKEGFNSDIGNLFLTSIKLQHKIDSNIVIYENVKGLVYHDKKSGEYKSLINKDYKKTIGHTLHTIEKLLLKDKRYNYYWVVINSSDQGLPQNRERTFIIGIKKKLDLGLEFPENRDLQFTVKDILEKNVDSKLIYKNTGGHTLIPTNQKRRNKKIHTIYKYDDSMKYESTRRVYSPYVSNCITTTNNSKFLIDGVIRRLSTTELKRIHGFSEDFKFVGSQTKQFKQLCNTVSPGVYKNLILSIFNSIKLPLMTEEVEEKESKNIENIEINKSIINGPDMNYLNITPKKYEEYMEIIGKGGKVILNIDKYENKEDKKNRVNSTKIRVEIVDLLPKGFRNKKDGFRRYKIVSKVSSSNIKSNSLKVDIKPINNEKFESVKIIDNRFINVVKNIVMDTELKMYKSNEDRKTLLVLNQFLRKKSMNQQVIDVLNSIIKIREEQLNKIKHLPYSKTWEKRNSEYRYISNIINTQINNTNYKTKKVS
jgi:DNA (cytosine-5)-methyltransferase 1